MVILGTTILGSLFLLLSARYFTEQRKDELERNVTVISKMVVANYYLDTESNSVKLNSGLVKENFELFSEVSHSAIFLSDIYGSVQFYTGSSTYDYYSCHIPENVTGRIDQNGHYFEMGKFGGFYRENYYTYGIPLFIQGDLLVGYLFITVPANTLTGFVSNMAQVVIFSALVVLFLTFIVAYALTAKIVRPLREMSAAAKRFGQGDFTTRVAIENDDEIGQLAHSFNNMASSLATQESVRRSFIANVSHELRTPMTSISGFVDGILDGTIRREDQRHYLTIVSEEIKRLSRLVKSMLNLSRIEAGELKINASQFNIMEVIIQTILSFEAQLNAKELSIEGLDQEDVLVNADPDLIHQVVYNLTENAVKFVNQGGYIRFSVYNENDKIVVSIRNSGEGLSREELPKIFDRFYKTDRSRGIDKSGVGLGLYIVRSVVQLHGGEISVKSVQGEYTEFVFTLPDTVKQKSSPIAIGREKEYPAHSKQKAEEPPESPAGENEEAINSEEKKDL